jgi:hypothetical protein
MQSSNTLKTFINNGGLGKINLDIQNQILELIDGNENKKRALIQELAVSRETINGLEENLLVINNLNEVLTTNFNNLRVENQILAENSREIMLGSRMETQAYLEEISELTQKNTDLMCENVRNYHSTIVMTPPDVNTIASQVTNNNLVNPPFVNELLTESWDLPSKEEVLETLSAFFP